MDTATLAALISLAGLGFTMMRLMWRAIDKRFDRLEAQNREIIAILRDHGERIAHIEGREEARAG